MNKRKWAAITSIFLIAVTTCTLYVFNNRVSNEKTTTFNVQTNGDVIKLDISHRYYSEIKLKGNQETYLRFLFNLNVKDIGTDYTLRAVSTGAWVQGTGIDVEIPNLPQGCRVSSKYVLTDTQGSGESEGVQLAVVADLRAGAADWTITDPKIAVENILLDLEGTLPYWYSPMILLNVDVTRMTESEYLSWLNSVTPPPPPGEPGYWEATLPGKYSVARGMFINTFPEFEATGLHYKNPYLGPQGGPSISTLDLDVAYLKEYSNSIDDTVNLVASGLRIYISPILNVPTLPYLEIAADDAQMLIDLHEPYADGVYGELTATFKGNVKFHIPEVPGLAGFDYVGPELTAKLTFIEPRYSVSVSPNELTITKGTEMTDIAEVTVEPLSAVVNNVRLEWRGKPGLDAGFEPSQGIPPYTSSMRLKAYCEPGVYDAKVVVIDTSVGEASEATVKVTVTGGEYQPTFNIGVIVPTANSEYWGQIIKFAQEDIDAFCEKLGYDAAFNFIVEEADPSQPGSHLEKVKGFHSTGVDLIIGGFWSSQAQESLDYINNNGMLLFSPSSTGSTLAIEGDNLFRLSPSEITQASAIAEMLWSWGIKAVIVIQRDDFWANSTYDLLKDELIKRGVALEEGSRIIYPQGTTDFSTYLTSAETKANELIGTYGAEHVGVFILSIEETNDLVTQANNYQTINGLIWFGSEGTIFTSVPANAENLKIFSTLSAPTRSSLWEALNERYITNTGRSLGYYEGCLYDVAWIYAKAVLLAGKMDPMAVKQVLPDVANEHFGVTGWCNLNAAGDRSKSNYEIWGVDGNPQWIVYGLYDMFTGKVTWYTDLGISPPGQ